MSYSAPKFRGVGPLMILREPKFFSKDQPHLDSHVTIERILNGIDRITVIGRTYGIVKETDNPFDVPMMHLWTFKDGRAARLEIVLDVPIMPAALKY